MTTVSNEPEISFSRNAIEILDEHFHPKEASIEDDRVTGRQIAEAAGYNSSDELIVLQQLKNGALEEIRLEELVDIKQAGIERFFVIEADRTFRFILDGLKLEWPRSRINAETLRCLVRKSDNFDVVYQLDDAPDRKLNEDEFVDLSGHGTERFKTKEGSKLVTVFYGEDLFELPKGTYTTEQLVEIFKVEAGYLLDLVVDGKLVQLKPGEQIPLKTDMHFTSHPPRGQSS